MFAINQTIISGSLVRDVFPVPWGSNNRPAAMAHLCSVEKSNYYGRPFTRKHYVPCLVFGFAAKYLVLTPAGNKGIEVIGQGQMSTLRHYASEKRLQEYVPWAGSMVLRCRQLKVLSLIDTDFGDEWRELEFPDWRDLAPPPSPYVPRKRNAPEHTESPEELDTTVEGPTKPQTSEGSPELART